MAPSSHPPAERIADALREANCEVVSCPDVYRALARMGGVERGRLRAVVVCVDLMSTDQFEFFQLAARHHRRVSVYVYAWPHAQSKIDLALRSGAKDAIRADALDLVLPNRPPAPAVIGSEPTSAAAGSVEPGVAEPVARKPVDEHAAPAQSDGLRAEEPSSDQDEPAGPARVPWLRYQGGPQRIPPQQTPAMTQTSEPDASEPEPPLLSPEELRALIGDETGDDSGNGRGRRGDGDDSGRERIDFAQGPPACSDRGERADRLPAPSLSRLGRYHG